MPRFVVLRHEFPEGHSRTTHWDLMFECRSWLRTWALENEPLSRVEIIGRELANHRLDYLEYEGPISGGRGAVTRWDRGEYELIADEPDEFRASLRGYRLRALIIVRKSSGDYFWTVSFSAEPTTGESSPSA